MKCTNNINKIIVSAYNVSSDKTQKKFLKLVKIGPNTRKVVSAPTTNTETNLAHLEVLLTQSVYPQ